MELFSRRYLCLFAFLFIFVSAMATIVGGTEKLLCLLGISLFILVAFIVVFVAKKHRFLAAVVLTSLIFSFLALFNSFVFITLPKTIASAYIGEDIPAKVRIISCERNDNTTSEYLVRIEQIGDNDLNIKGYLYCDFSTELDYGDRVICSFDIEESIGSESSHKDVLLVLNNVDEAPVYYNKAESPSYFSFDGIVRMCKGIRQSFIDHVDRVYGKEVAPIVKGFLINETEDIHSSVEMDFKRSGTTHLLAVSGLHITLLLGSLEILLRKIYVPKKIRCMVILVGALFLLILAGFSASAVRSVFMLYAVYLSFLFYEDHDTVTALFASVFVIILISPFSVYDLGLWMSFLATLGLVTVYAYADKKLCAIKVRGKANKVLFKALIFVVRAVLITITANLFLLPIMWLFFGEVSLASIPANLILSPIVALFMPLCAIGVIIGSIPGVGTVIVYVIELFERVILAIVDLFSEQRGAVLSLNYPFVTWLIIVFSIVMTVMLVIKLKHKLLIAIPPAVLAVSFCICLTVFLYNNQPTVKYFGNKNGDILFVDKAGESTVCDVTYGGYRTVTTVISEISELSTEIDNYIITHPHKTHAGMIDRLLSKVYVRNLYIPVSTKPDEILYAKDIYDVAQTYDINVIFYKSGREIELFDGLSIYAHFEERDTHDSIFLSIADEECIFTYVDASECRNGSYIGAQSRYFLLGEHGSFDESIAESVKVSDETKVIFASNKRFENTRLICPQAQGYVIKQNELKKIIELPLK